MWGDTSEPILLWPLFPSYSQSPLRWKGWALALLSPFLSIFPWIIISQFGVGWHSIFPLFLWLKYGRVQGERNDDHNSGGISKLLYLSFEQMLISHSLLVTHKAKEESLMVFLVFWNVYFQISHLCCKSLLFKVRSMTSSVASCQHLLEMQTLRPRPGTTVSVPAFQQALQRCHTHIKIWEARL